MECRADEQLGPLTLGQVEKLAAGQSAIYSAKPVSATEIVTA